MSREIQLTQGRVAIVSDEDAEAVLALGAWQVARCDGRTYASHGLARGAIYLHRFLLPDAPLVDHINGDGLDNRRSNLRPATPSQNGANISAPRHNTSGYKGVSLYRRTARWRAYITVDQQHIHLGYFATPIEAAAAYDVAAATTWGEHARLNFPEGIPA